MYIKVRVLTKQRKDSVEELKKNSFKVFVKEKPERNMANNKVIMLIAGYFGVNETQVRIINGHHSPSKLLSVCE